MPVCWLASYPKSGNTWVRLMMANYLTESGDGWSWNEQLSGVPSHLDRFHFDETTGISSADLDPIALRKARGKFNQFFAQDADNFRLVKTHEAFVEPIDGRTIFPSVAGAKAIYLIRNPLDLVSSYAHHEGRPVDDIIQALSSTSAKIKAQRLFFDEHLGTWSDHVTGWTEQSDISVLALRYEDLVAEPNHHFAQIIQFCELDFSKDKLAAALEATRFDRLQEQERIGGFHERAPGAANFFRSGKVGGWRNELTDAQVEQITADHGAVMDQWGYL